MAISSLIGKKSKTDLRSINYLLYLKLQLKFKMFSRLNETNQITVPLPEKGHFFFKLSCLKIIPSNWISRLFHLITLQSKCNLIAKKKWIVTCDLTTQSLRVHAINFNTHQNREMWYSWLSRALLNFNIEHKISWEFLWKNRFIHLNMTAEH